MSDKRINSVRLIWLEAFVAVAKHGSYKDAGEELKIDPTVINGYIVKLEKWLNLTLFLKSYKKPKITNEGEEFLPKAKTIIDILYTSQQYVFNSENMHEMGPLMTSFINKHMREEKRKLDN